MSVSKDGYMRIVHGRFQKTPVWAAAQDLAVYAHKVSGRFAGCAECNAMRSAHPRRRCRFPLISLREARTRVRENFARFLQYALASATEVEGHIQLARDVGMMTEHDYDAL
jgi:four helix bundle protein